MVAFIVLSYNAVGTVVRTLNSVKYQIEHYGDGRRIQIILADDCSTDGTKEVAARWIDSNKGLFDEITILESIKNVGTCKNLGKAFRSLKTEFFLVIAGDDVISKQNVFRKMDIMEDCDVLLNSIMMFKASDLSIIRNKRKYLDAVIQCCESRRFIKWISGVGCPIQNGAIYRTSLLTEDVLQYMERFHILDDRTRFYAIFKQKNIRVKYDNEPILLYCISDKSVTGTSGGFLSVLNKDLEDFYNAQYEESRNIIVRMYLKYKLFLSKYRKRSAIYYLDPYYFVMALKILFNHRKIQRNTSELIEKYAIENEGYLKML